MDESDDQSRKHSDEADATLPLNKEPLEYKKLVFDDNQFWLTSQLPDPPGSDNMQPWKKNVQLAYNVEYKQTKPRTLNPPYWKYICYWNPVLFGIDEESIPPEANIEDLFDDPELIKELEEEANALTNSDLDFLRIGSQREFTDDELRNSWKKNKIPRYGRRARQKPILTGKDNEKFECICDIDRSYSRHYIPRFDKGAQKDKEEMRTPHFVAYWEDYHDKSGNQDMNKFMDIFELKTEQGTEKEKYPYSHHVSTFPRPFKKDIQNFRQNILGKFRPLNCREIRRYRMPFAEALYLELQEDKFLESAFFFKRLLTKDYYVHIHEDLDRSSGLRQNKSMLLKLVMFLKLAEMFSQKKEYHREAIVLLKSGKFFNEYDSSWWWLTEQLYMRAVNVSSKTIIDGGKAEAISRYVLGTFLLDCVHRVKPAQEHLLKAREISMGKDWNAGRILKKPQEPVYKECSNYLCQALIATSKELRKSGKPEEALPLIHRSYKLCEEAGTERRDIEMETYFELGMTYQAVGMLDWAKTAFRKFILIAQIENYPKRVCDGYLEIAICYRSEGDYPRCHHNLLNYVETAESKMDENLLAFGHRYLGEFHLNSGNSIAAAEFFRLAFYSFHTQCIESLNIPYESRKPEHFTLLRDVELTRVLIGLAEGERLTKPLCNLILKSRDLKNQNDILKLIMWKNNGQVLFEVEESEEKKPVQSKAVRQNVSIFDIISGEPRKSYVDHTKHQENEEDTERNKALMESKIVRFAS